MITEKLNNLLFHPSTIAEYRYTKLYKTLFFILILAIISTIVPIIDVIQNPGITLADKALVEQVTDFDFKVAKTLPDCEIKKGSFSCESGNHQEIGEFLRLFTIVTDVDNDYSSTESMYYLKLTEDSIKLVNQNNLFYSIPYKNLPSKWQNVDFNAISQSSNPEEELYIVFMSGFNQIAKALLPFDIIFRIGMSFVFKIVEILFLSVLFLLLYNRFKFKFEHVFKVTVFAHTLPVILGLMFQLMGLATLSSFIVTTLTFIYVYIALLSSIPKEQTL